MDQHFDIILNVYVTNMFIHIILINEAFVVFSILNEFVYDLLV